MSVAEMETDQMEFAETRNQGTKPTLYLTLAQRLFEQGKLAAQVAASGFYDLGFAAHQLSQIVTDEEGQEVELWTLLAPAGISSPLMFFADEWNIPESSIAAARAHISFFHTILGLSVLEIKNIGRGKLSVAKAWLEETFKYGQTDMDLIKMLRSGAPYLEIRHYVSTAREEYAKQLNKPKKIKLGKFPVTAVVPEPSEDAVEAAGEDLDDAEDVETGTEPEHATERSVGLRKNIEGMAEVRKQLEPVALSMSGNGEPLSRVVFRVIYDQFSSEIVPEMTSEQRDAWTPFLEKLRETMEQRFGQQRQYPLIFWDDDQPQVAGIVILDTGIQDEEMLDRVIRGLRQQLKS